MQEYNLPDVRDRQFLLTMHKRAKKHGLDLDHYNNLKRKVAEVEHDLRRLRDPLQLHIPSKPPKSFYDSGLFANNNLDRPTIRDGLRKLIFNKTKK